MVNTRREIAVGAARRAGWAGPAVGARCRVYHRRGCGRDERHPAVRWGLRLWLQSADPSTAFVAECATNSAQEDNSQENARDIHEQLFRKRTFDASEDGGGAGRPVGR